jgi:hypothetical protein
MPEEWENNELNRIRNRRGFFQSGANYYSGRMRDCSSARTSLFIKNWDRISHHLFSIDEVTMGLERFGFYIRNFYHDFFYDNS